MNSAILKARATTAIAFITVMLGLGSGLNGGCATCPSGTQAGPDGKCRAPATGQEDPSAEDAAVQAPPAPGRDAGKAVSPAQPPPVNGSKTNAVAKDAGPSVAGKSGGGTNVNVVDAGSAADQPSADPAANNMGTPAANGMDMPAANGMGDPAANNMGMPAAGCDPSAAPHCDEQGKMLMCDGSGGETPIATCKSKQLCEAGLSNGSCAACLSGDSMCQGTMLMRCSADGSAFEPETDCMSQVLCDAANGTCKPAACEANSYECQGDRLNVCKSDLTGFQLSKQCAAGLCDADSKSCKQCNPGAMTCSGNTIMMCDAQGTRSTAGTTCADTKPVCDAQRGCVECKSKTDCKTVHDCADASGCNGGTCAYTAKPRSSASGNGKMVRAGNPDPDPIYVVFGNALFYISTEDEVNQYGGFNSVTSNTPLGGYQRCPVKGTLLMERGDTVGYIYSSDGNKLNWVKSPADLEMYCGGSSSIVTVPAGSLTTSMYVPPQGLCPVNKN